MLATVSTASPRPSRRFGRSLGRLFLLLGLLLAALPGRSQTWSYENIRDDPREGGQFPVLRSDSSGTLHLLYWNQHTDQLYYGQRPADSAWQFEAVAPNIAGGFEADLLIREGHSPEAAFFANVNGKMLPYYARRQPGGGWTKEVISSDSFGEYGPSARVNFNRVQASLSLTRRDSSVFVSLFDATFEGCDQGDELELNLKLARRSPAGSWSPQGFPNFPISYINQVPNEAALFEGNGQDACEATAFTNTNDNTRYGEFCNLRQRGDGDLAVFTVDRLNGALVQLKESFPGAVPATQWSRTVIYDNLSFVDTIHRDRHRFIPEFVDVEVTPDSNIHIAFNVSDLYGKNQFGISNRGFNVFFIKYMQFDRAGNVLQDTFVGVDTGAAGVATYRRGVRLEVLTSDSIALSYADESDGSIHAAFSADSGQSWTDHVIGTGGNLRMAVPLSRVGDSLHVVHFDDERKELVHTRQALDALSSGWLSTPIRLNRASGALLEARIRPKGTDTLETLLHYDSATRALMYGQDSTGSWQFDSITLGLSLGEIAYDLGPNDVPAASLANLQTGRLNVAQWTGTNWQVNEIQAFTAGRSHELRIDSTGRRHLAYHIPQDNRLVYQQGSGNLYDPQEVIDASDSSQDGIRTAMLLDAQGRPALASLSFDQSVIGTPGVSARHILKYARRLTDTAAQNWSLDTVLIDTSLVLPLGLDMVWGPDGYPWIFLLGEFDTPTLRLLILHQKPNGNWTADTLPNFFNGGENAPMHGYVDDQGRPWVVFNVVGAVDEIFMANRGVSSAGWSLFPINNNLNNGRIASKWDFEAFGPSFFIHGQKQAPDDPGLASLRLADWRSIVGRADAEQDELAGARRPPFEATLFPNPVRENATLRFQMRQPGRMELVIYDTRGRVVRREPGRFWDEGEQEWPLQLGELSGGVYVYRLYGNAGSTAGRILVRGN